MIVQVFSSLGWYGLMRPEWRFTIKAAAVSLASTTGAGGGGGGFGAIFLFFHWAL